MRRAWPLWALAALALSGGGFAVYRATRGLRNDNPGNIRAVSGVTWVGQVGIDDKGFVVFDSWQNGVRAMAITLRNYQRHHGLSTVAEIISRWAPGVENDTASYIGDVSNRMGVTPAQSLNLENDATLTALVQAVIHHENGLQPYDVATLTNTVMAA